MSKKFKISGLPNLETIQLEGEPKVEDFSILEEYLKAYWIWLEKELLKKRSLRPNPDDYDASTWYRVCDEHSEWNKNHPATKLAARLYQSLWRIEDIMDDAEDIVCPICEKSGKDNLVFKCHPDMTMKQALEFSMLKRGATYVREDEKK